MRRVSVSLLLTSMLMAVPVVAQIQIRPTDAPIVTASNESWYINREPIQFAGDLYYPAGAAVFFDGNAMVRSGHYNGVPLYTDTTLEPYSVVYVPIERGVMQPYERLRQGSLAGTTASRAPSFPVKATASSAPLLQAASSPTAPPQPIGAVSVYTPESTPGISGTSIALPVGPGGVPAPEPGRQNRTTIVTIGRPTSNDGLWIP